jgi:LPXTG-site transpeptidase (sortase) family protein
VSFGPILALSQSVGQSTIRGSKIARYTETLLWTGGILALSTVGLEWARSAYDQWQGSLELAELRQAFRPTDSLPEGALFGRVAIPHLGFSAIVFEGVGESTLAKGVGHLRVGDSTNRHIVLAGHRDTFFRPLRNIQVGESIEVSMPEGRNIYTVTSTSIVNPTDTGVIHPTAEPIVTLITCYPFSFLGPAPQRFIVRAALAKNK